MLVRKTQHKKANICSVIKIPWEMGKPSKQIEAQAELKFQALLFSQVENDAQVFERNHNAQAETKQTEHGLRKKDRSWVCW